MTKINLASKFELFDQFWNPKIIGSVNDLQIKLVKLKGEFLWHHHEKEDEMFLVIKGNFTMEFKDNSVTINEGEMIIVPKGVEHKPVAIEEAWVLLCEPGSTLNTGNQMEARTQNILENI